MSKYDWATIQAFYDDGHSFREITKEFGAAHLTIQRAAVSGLFKPRGPADARRASQNPSQQCVICSTKLSGRQVKYCSEKCCYTDTNAKNQNYKVQQNRGMQRKIQLVEACGGRCSSCGYDKNYAALCFHHLRDKRYEITLRKMSNSTWEDILEEASRCVLLCHNCHMDVHYPHMLKENW